MAPGQPAASLRDVMEQIAETDLVVATRFHNVVCALKLARPTVSLGYARKNDVLLAEMGLGAFCQHVEAIDLDLLKTQFGSSLASSTRIGSKSGRRFRPTATQRNGRLKSSA